MKPGARQMVAGGVTALALLLLLTGMRRSVKVYEDDTAEFGLMAFRRIGDRQLVVDSTFTGVVRRGSRLYTTYDRSQQRGKRMCPS